MTMLVISLILFRACIIDGRHAKRANDAMEDERVARTRAAARRAKVGVEVQRFALGCLEVQHAARHQDGCYSAKDGRVSAFEVVCRQRVTHGSVNVVITLLTWPVFLAILNRVSERTLVRGCSLLG